MEQQLARAKGYPYPRPDTSFLFVNGDLLLFDNDQWRGLDHLHNLVGRCGSTSADFAAARGVDLAALAQEDVFWPVLAIGSNAGPEQLRRKYPLEDFPGCVIPVVQVALEDFDVVYTPYIASYGSCTATLEHSPGTVASIFITYLTAPLMQRMHATEGGYNLCRLSGLRLHVAPKPVVPPGPGDPAAAPVADLATAAAAAAAAGADGHAAGFGAGSFELRDWVYQYNHQLGCINLPVEGLGGSAVAIAEIPAHRRAFPAASQVRMLAALRLALGASSLPDGALTPVQLPGFEVEDAGLDSWILRMIDNSRARQAMCTRLEQHARPFSYPLSEVIVAL